MIVQSQYMDENHQDGTTNQVPTNKKNLYVFSLFVNVNNSGVGHVLL